MSGSEAKKPFERLPANVIPVNYALHVTPDLQQFTFTGTVSIDVQVKEATNTVMMNCIEIEIEEAEFRAGQMVVKGDVSLNEGAETLTLTFPQPLPEGKALVCIKYKGILNDKMKGFYRSKYTTPSGEERFGAVTQFEAPDARRAFPCWDEPGHKATFDVTITAPKDRVVLSNMDVIKEEEQGDLKTVMFNRTPIMSTYLLAFIVGEYDYIEGHDADGIRIRVYTPVGKKEQGRFALEVARKTLPFYKEYFQVAYPLPKMDLIAIADFAAGAMENWGLVTYRERILLVDPVNTSQVTKQYVALVVGHELAHQWFGNLVTMEWWTHLWLNEGFASWIEYLCVDHCLPDYQIWTQFLTGDFSRALQLDALANSHPIEVEVGSPEEVEEIFDAISYCKGASIIRMLHNWVGDKDFRTGMNEYLTKFAYKNAATEDLWASLSSASGKPVDTVMSTWTKKMGYPVLTVSAKQEGSSRHVTISQAKFCADGCDEPYKDYQWMIPITIATKKNQSAHSFVLDSKQATVTIENVDPSDWVKLNPGSVGFYRVTYDAEMITLLLQAVSDGSLETRDRIQLIDDVFALAQAGVGSTVKVLELMSAYADEKEFTVWETLVGNLGSLSRLLANTDYHDKFKTFAVKIFDNVVDRVGWMPQSDESPLTSMMRSMVISAHGHYGNSKTIENAQSKFDDHVFEKAICNVDLRTTVFSLAMKHGTEETFDQLRKLHSMSDSQEENVRLYRAMGYGQTPSLVTKCLDYAMSDKVRAQDCCTLFASAANSSKMGREVTWQFVRDNWQKMRERFTGSFMLQRMVSSVCSEFANEERAKEVEEFFMANPTASVDRTVKQCCEAIRLNTKWLNRDREAIASWLNRQL